MRKIGSPAHWYGAGSPICNFFCTNVGTGSKKFDDDSRNVWKRRVASSLIWGWQLCLQKYFFLRRNSYVIFFRLLQFYAKSRVGSEGVTGLKTRGRPPRLDDKQCLRNKHNQNVAGVTPENSTSLMWVLKQRFALWEGTIENLPYATILLTHSSQPSVSPLTSLFPPTMVCSGNDP